MSEHHFWDLRLPLESHLFSQCPKNDFLCHICQRPRCLHQHDGFIPSGLPSMLPTAPDCTYRGPHPRFTKPGTNRGKDRDER